MAPDPAVDAFDQRADAYDRGRLGEWHRLITRRTADIALSAVPMPTRILDVGCGTGALLRQLGTRLPQTVELVGVDPAPRMVVRSRTALGQDPRVIVEQAAAEGLPFTDRTFDLVVTTMSFDHWTDQQRGLAECARVLRDGGRLVLADLIAAWLRPTAGLGRRRRARTVELAARLLTRAGFRGLHWQSVYDLGPFGLVQAVVAVR